MSEPHVPKVSRRVVLKGMGAALALPFLPSLALAQGGRGEALTPPRRWATLVFANGVNTEHWWVKGDAGGLREFSRSLKPIEQYKDDLLFLDNLHLFDDTVGVHTPYFTNFLCGQKLGEGSIPNLSTSVDQIIAKEIGRMTAVPSIALGIEPASYGLTGGKPAIYGSTISWSSPTTPVAPEVSPRQAFDRLFDTSQLLRERSVLDVVLAQSKSIERRLDAHDRNKLQEYMASIREIEQRIDRATAGPDPNGWQPTLSEPDMARPEEGRPSSLPEHMKLMLDILVLSFQMDKTRIATFLFQKDITGMSFNFLEGVSSTGMHTISHHRKRAAALAEYQKINEFHVEQLAYIIGRMKSIDEGNGSMLDNTMMLFGSTMRDGDVHDANDLPLMIVGGRNCGIRGNRLLRYESLQDRRLCNLHLAMAQRMGVDTDQVGNSLYPLPGLDG